MAIQPVNIVIVGGGFSGVAAARRLAAYSSACVTLVSETPYHMYYPALFRVLAGKDRALTEIPLVDVLPKNVHIRVQNVVKVSVQPKQVTLANGTVLDADILILATGMELSYFNISGADQTTLPFRTVSDALKIRNRVHSLLREHAQCDIDEQIVSFRFLVVGAGPSGCEIAGVLHEYANQCAKKYKLDDSLISVDILEGRDRVLPTLGLDASSIAKQRLRSIGVYPYLHRRLMQSRSWTATLSDSSLGTKTVIWSAGLAPSRVSQKIEGLQYSERGKIEVNEFGQALGHSDVYIMGDIANTVKSGLAQTAIYDGLFVAENIMRGLKGQTLKTYIPRRIFSVTPIGNGWAVGEMFGFTFSGYLAWVMRCAADSEYYLSVLPLGKAWKRIIQLDWFG